MDTPPINIEAQVTPQPPTLKMVEAKPLPQVVEAQLPKFTEHTSSQLYYMTNASAIKDGSIQ